MTVMEMVQKKRGEVIRGNYAYNVFGGKLYRALLTIWEVKTSTGWKKEA